MSRHITTHPTASPQIHADRLRATPSAAHRRRRLLTTANLPEDQQVTALVDPRFPYNDVVLFADTSSETADSIAQPFPSSAVRASVTAWSPSQLSIKLTGSDTRTGHLLVSTNWYPDWHATVDGRAATVRRADHSLIGVDVPPGATEVHLWFDSPAYARGKLVSALALLVAVLMVGLGSLRDREATA